MAKRNPIFRMTDILSSLSGCKLVFTSFRDISEIDIFIDGKTETIATVHSIRNLESEDIAAFFTDVLNAAIPDENAPTLSNREKEVLTLVASGAHYDEIASLLSIAEGTVKTYVEQVTRKLGTKNKIHSVSVALTKGIIRI